MAAKSGLIDEAASIKLKALNEGQIAAEGWMGKYQDSVAAGKEDDLMLKMSKADLTDETWAAFNKDKAQYDAATDAISNDIRVARQLGYNDYVDTIDASTSKGSVDAYINDNKWLSGGQINTLRGAIRSAKDDEEFMMGMFVDTTSSKRRKILNKALDETQEPEQLLTDAIALTAQVGTSPEYLTNMANNYADSTTQGSLITIGDALLDYYSNPDTAGVPLPMTDSTRAKTQLYMSMVSGKVPKTDAEATVNELFKNQTEDKVQARKAAWVSERFSEKGTPEEYVTKQMTKRLKDRDDPVGQLFVADTGAGFFNLEDKYEDIKLSSLMEYELGQNARNMYLATQSLEVAINAPLNAMRARGAAATDINFDVAVSTKQLEGNDGNGFEIQLNPITKSLNNGEILPRQQVRDFVAKEISGMVFKAQFMPGDAKEYSIGQIEIGDGQIATYGPNKGKMQWPLKTMGGILTHDYGEQKNQPAYFYWPDTVDFKAKEPVKEKAAKVVNEALPPKKITSDRSDYTDTGVATF
jgi:hypothetical protein